ncbi:MAG: glycosyltransferase family 4 protein [Thermoleophilaceae bacterium]
MSDPRPACLVTGAVSEYRREPFRLLARREGVEVIAWQEAGPPVPGLAIHRTTQAGAARLVASGSYRAVICSLSGRVAPLACYAAARARGLPFVLWTGIWEHPRTPAHLLSRLAANRLYRGADAVATYGEHVSRHVARERGARGCVEVAPQAVDVGHFGASVPSEDRRRARELAGGEGTELLVLYVGRLEEEKGVRGLLEAWRGAGLGPGARLAMAGSGQLRAEADRSGGDVRTLGYVPRSDLPPLYAAADLLVLPSARTATFTEPWGLVVNEAMLQRNPVITSDAVGAAAGGLVRNGRNGLVFPAGDAGALGVSLRTLAAAPELRERLGACAREDARRLTPAAWAEGMARALFCAGATRGSSTLEPDC